MKQELLSIERENEKLGSLGVQLMEKREAKTKTKKEMDAIIDGMGMQEYCTFISSLIRTVSRN